MERHACSAESPHADVLEEQPHSLRPLHPHEREQLAVVMRKLKHSQRQWQKQKQTTMNCWKKQRTMNCWQQLHLVEVEGSDGRACDVCCDHAAKEGS